jgi:tetratricopeptide (TPR) repeat protein
VPAARTYGLLVICLYLLMPLFATAQISSTDSANVYRLKLTASYLLKEKRYEEAILCFDSVLKLIPGNRSAHIGIAEGHFHLGNYNYALSHLNRLLEINANDTDVVFKKVLVLLSMENYKDALTVIDHYIQLSPKDPEGWYYKGYCQKNEATHSYGTFGDKSNYRKAIKSLNNAIELAGGSHYKSFVVLGNIYKNMDDLPSALNYYQKAIAADSSEGLPYINMGDVKLKQKDTANALLYFNRAMEIDPFDDYNLTVVNSHLLKLGMIEKVTRQTEALLANDSTSLNGLLAMGALLLREKKYNEALSFFNKAIDYHPGASTAFYYRGIARICLDDKKQGRKDIEQAAAMGNVMARRFIETNPANLRNWLPTLYNVLRMFSY